MNKEWHQLISQFFEAKNRAWLSGKTEELLDYVEHPDVIRSCREDIHALSRSAANRGVEYRKSRTNLKVVHAKTDRRGKWDISLQENLTFIYKQDNELQHQARMQPVSLTLGKKEGRWQIERIHRLGEKDQRKLVPSELDFRSAARPNYRQLRYNRLQAQKYAELWWNDFNPQYKKFDDDCTNFISQCLHAGGMPMDFRPQKGRGWWYRSHGGGKASWSYSWAVAHALMRYLEGSGRATAVANPQDLAIGDVICYDFDGDGRWQHNTIVVDFDANGMPLVNAHTNASQRRYWDYQDSYAWTENTKYRFFRIHDYF